MKLFLVAAVAMITFHACGENRAAPRAPAFATDGGPPEPAPCVAVCAHYAELGCPAARPTPRGGSCENVCLNAVESGLIHWDLGCRANAPSCEGADACEAPRVHP